MTSSRSLQRAWVPFALLLACALVTTGGPKKGPAERAGETIDRGVDEAGDSLEKTGDEIGDSTDR